jgi:WD40 repeat protein
VIGTLALSSLRNAARAERHRQNADLRAGEARSLNASLQVALRSKDEALEEAKEALEAARLARNEAGKEAKHARRAERGERAQRLAAVDARQRAEQESLRARRAERDRTEQLWASYLAEAQARRWSGRVGQRFDSLAALARAAAIRPSLALRNEAIACMALADLRVKTQSSADKPLFWGSESFDADLKRYARGDAQGNISIRRVTDDGELLRLPGFGVPSVLCCFSPNGQFAAVKYHRGAEVHFYVWDLRRREAILKVPNGIVNGAMDFSPDSRQVAACRPGKLLLLYDLTTGRELQRVPLGHDPRAIRFHPDGQKLAVASLESSAAEVLALETGTVIASLPHPAPVWCTAWRSDGKVLAVGCSDFRTYLWDVAGRQRLAVLEGHEDYVTNVTFNHDGNLLASTGWDGTTRLWDPLTGRQLVSSSGAGTQFSPDDRLLGFALRAPRVELREVASSREYRTLFWLQESHGPLNVDFSPDGRLVAAACAGDVRLWDVATAREVASLPIKGSWSVLFHPDGNSLITHEPTGLRRWRIGPGPGDDTGGVRIMPPEILLPLTGPGYACLCRDGRTLAVGQQSAGRGYVLDLEDPSKRVLLQGQPGLDQIAISPNGQWIATGTWAAEWGPVRIWDARSGKPVRDLPPAVRGQSVAFSPDGRWLVTGVSREYRFWEVGSWRPGPRLPREAYSELPGPVAFARDGKLVAVASSLRQVKLIDPSRGRELATLEAPDPQGLGGLCFSPDGSRLAVAAGWRGSHGVRLWDLRLIRRQLRAMGLDWD